MHIIRAAPTPTPTVPTVKKYVSLHPAMIIITDTIRIITTEALKWSWINNKMKITGARIRNGLKKPYFIPN